MDKYIRCINLGSGNKCRKHCIIKYIYLNFWFVLFTITIQQRKCFWSIIIIIIIIITLVLEAATHPIEAFKFYSSFKRPSRKLSLNLLLFIFVSVWFAIFVRKYQDTKCLWFFFWIRFCYHFVLFSFRFILLFCFCSIVKFVLKDIKESLALVCVRCVCECGCVCVGGRACVPSRVQVILVSLWVCLARLMQNDITLMEGELKLKHGGDWQRSRRWRSVQTAHKMATHLQSLPLVFMCVCMWEWSATHLRVYIHLVQFPFCSIQFVNISISILRARLHFIAQHLVYN